MYPFTEILKPGPISNGRLENKARLATALEFMEDSREFRRDIPSPANDVLIKLEIGAGASGSAGDAL